MEFSVSALRQNIYNIIDRVLESGVPVFIRRKGKTLKISIEGATDKVGPLRNKVKRDIIRCDPEELVHIDWSTEWKGPV